MPHYGTRVLLVEDSAVNQKLFCFLLSQANFEVTTADNGSEALDKVSRAEDGGTPFDLILMDLEMPGIDGLSAIKFLKQAGNQTPVIALSGCTEPETIEACLQAGCVDYVSKPCRKEELISTIHAVLDQNQLASR